MKPIRTMVAMALACALQQGAWAREELKSGGGGVSYVSGGVGKEQQEALAARRPEFNLYLTFARGHSGEFLADVALEITDRKRNRVLAADGVGPQVLVKLPAGMYWVNATFGNQEQSRSVVIGNEAAGKGGREVTFHWNPADQATVR
ncbi:carboxypeptidase regulatory-like domain-containing protein [Massilia dura]|uniref:Carboxypeptidase regulatory-like domain-containing protein n=1 Tax=Pseudoduganella dura TaxID=321982 RepID=A0A6I3XKP9_9BURK|nr:carboxypeptidase regulatory-like domain-containing protein [Pseudoduganella dura]MUI16156.1 carboxypeptidase regulatory-like domain-containing protein [Pseudoduganella dura]GGY10534.1 hypothetical protein GCM10007386_46150 [Pseudoduganella dura]